MKTKNLPAIGIGLLLVVILVVGAAIDYRALNSTQFTTSGIVTLKSGALATNLGLTGPSITNSPHISVGPNGGRLMPVGGYLDFSGASGGYSFSQIVGDNGGHVIAADYTGSGELLTSINAASTNKFHQGATAVGAWTNASGQTVSGGILGTNYSTTAYYSVSNGALTLAGGTGAKSAQIQITNNVANANSNTVILPGYINLTNGSAFVVAGNGGITNTGVLSTRALNPSAVFGDGANSTVVLQMAGTRGAVGHWNSGFSYLLGGSGKAVMLTANASGTVPATSTEGLVLATDNSKVTMYGGILATTTVTATNGFIRIDTSTFPTSSIPVGSASVTNTIDIVYKGFPRTVATNRATTQGWMYWRTTDETWQTFTP